MKSITSLWYLIPAIFVLLLVIPIVFEVRGSYNLLKNSGTISLFVFKFKIFHYIFSFHKNGIELHNQKTKKFQRFEFSGTKFVAMEEFVRQIKDKVKLKNLGVYYNIGLGDAFSSAILCGIVNQMIVNLFIFFKNNKPTASLSLFDSVSFNREIFEVAVRGRGSISFFEIATHFRDCHCE